MDFLTIASAVLSVLGAIVAGVMTTWSAQRSRKLEHALEAERRRESKAEQTEEVISRYREPLLLAAQSLQGRLYNGVVGGYLEKYLHCGDLDEERYARDFTVYVYAEYLCWVEIIRRELRFLDLGNEQRNRMFNDHLQAVGNTFSSQRIPHGHFRLFRGQQRAIGELMMVVNGNGRADCMTYPAFCAQLDKDEEFERWFNRLRADVDAIAAHDVMGNTRLVHAQRALIDVIDFLDPDQVRISADRTKLPDPQPAHPTLAVV